MQSNLSACGAGCDVSRPLWATDRLPGDSLATGAVEPSASRRGLRRLPSASGDRLASLGLTRHGCSRTVRLRRGLRRLPSALRGRSASCGSFATGAVEPSGSGAGCDVSRRFGRSIGFLAAHSPRVQSTCPAPARVATFPVRFGRSIGFLGTHSPRVQSNRPPAARVATSPRFGRSIGFLAAHSPRVQSTCPAPAQVATSPVRFARPIGSRHSPRAQSTCPAPAQVATFPVRFGRSIGFLGTHSPPSATVARAGLSSPTAPAIFPVRVAVGRSRGLAGSVSSRSRPPRARARC